MSNVFPPNTYTLVPYGMSDLDDDDVRNYFTKKKKKPDDLGELARWHWVSRVFAGCRWGPHADLEWLLSSFYLTGPAVWFSRESGAAREEYFRHHPDEPQPIGGAALIEWHNNALSRPRIAHWCECAPR